MEEIFPKVGRVVYSKLGRDKGKYYVIYEVLENGYVTIVDGDIRKLDNPKKKNIKHLKMTYDCLDGIASKIANKVKIFDKEIVSALRVYNKEN